MVAKKPPKATPHFDNAKAAARQHPWWSIGISLSSIAALVAIVSVVGPWAWNAYTGWVGAFQTTAAAKADRDAAILDAAKIRTEFAAQDVIIRAEFKAQAMRDQQKLAWMQWGQNDVKTLILRNRVNECVALKAKTRLQPAEAANCSQYDREYDDAAARAKDLYKAAMDAGKGN